MEENKNPSWKNVRFTLNGIEINATPLIVKPKHIQEISYILKTPNVRRICSLIIKADLFLN